MAVHSTTNLEHSMVFYVYADLCSLLAATSQFSILIGQNMQLTGYHNGNEMCDATCADTQISIEWPYCSFLYCAWKLSYRTASSQIRVARMHQ